VDDPVVLDELQQEGRRLLNLIRRASNWPGGQEFTARDVSFVSSMQSRLPDCTFSRKQIYWLRDIAAKCE